MKKKDLESKIAELKQEAINEKIIEHAYSLATDEYFSKIDRKVLSNRVSLSYDFIRPGIGIHIGNYIYGPFYVDITHNKEHVFHAKFNTYERDGLAAFEPIELKKYIQGNWVEELKYAAENKNSIKEKELVDKKQKRLQEIEETPATKKELKSAYKNFRICEE